MEVRLEIGLEICSEIRSEIRLKIGSEICLETHSEICSEIRSEIHSEKVKLSEWEAQELGLVLSGSNQVGVVQVGVAP